jgi:hypothetical protein
MKAILFLAVAVEFCAPTAFAQPEFVNPSFEEPGLGACPNSQYSPAGSSWTFNGKAGITTAGCRKRFNAPTPPESGGNQVAFIQSRTERASGPVPGAVSQEVSGFVAGHAYSVVFHAAGRPTGAGCSNACSGLDFSVFAGDVNILDVVGLQTDQFHRYTTHAFTAVGTVQIQFGGAAPDGADQSAFIDMVSIQDLGPTEGVPSIVSPGPDNHTTSTLRPISRAVPISMSECEARPCETFGDLFGIWTFNGKNGRAQWNDGARADLTIERFDTEKVLIHRRDPNGFWADYTGNMDGNRIDGTVVWHFQNGRVGTGKWMALFGEALQAMLWHEAQQIGNDAIQSMSQSIFNGIFGPEEEEWQKKGYTSDEAYRAHLQSCRQGKAVCP